MDMFSPNTPARSSFVLFGRLYVRLRCVTVIVKDTLVSVEPRLFERVSVEAKCCQGRFMTNVLAVAGVIRSVRCPWCTRPAFMLEAWRHRSLMLGDDYVPTRRDLRRVVADWPGVGLPADAGEPPGVGGDVVWDDPRVIAWAAEESVFLREGMDALMDTETHAMRAVYGLPEGATEPDHGLFGWMDYYVMCGETLASLLWDLEEVSSAFHSRQSVLCTLESLGLCVTLETVVW